MKKLYLLNLIFTLCFYNFVTAERYIFQDNLLLNGLRYAINLFGIKACDSRNPNEIKANAAINGLQSAYLGFKNVKDIIDYYNNAKNAGQSEKALNAILALWSVQLLVGNVKFSHLGLKVFYKARKIAKFNKKIKLSMTNEKIKQVIWLTFNTVLPYLCYAVTRIYYDKIELKSAFYKEVTKTNEDASEINGLSTLFPASDIALSLGRLISDTSEMTRKKILYKKVKREIQRRLKQNI